MPTAKTSTKYWAYKLRNCQNYQKCAISILNEGVAWKYILVKVWRGIKEAGRVKVKGRVIRAVRRCWGIKSRRRKIYWRIGWKRGGTKQLNWAIDASLSRSWIKARVDRKWVKWEWWSYKSS